MDTAAVAALQAQVDRRGERSSVRQILLIENDDGLRGAITDLFEAKGYRCDSCRGAHDALVLLREGARPNAILLDSLAPDLSEWTLRVSQKEDASATLVVASSSDLGGGRAVALDADVVVLERPLDLGMLFETVDNVISSRLQHQQREQTAELLRLTALGELAGAIAHEVNNPLAFVVGDLELMREPLRDLEADLTGKASHARERLEHLVGGAQRAADRVAAVMRGVMLFATTDTSSVGAVDVHAALEGSLQVASNSILACAKLVRSFHPVPMARGNSARLGQVFLNILLDAVHAIREGGDGIGVITVSTFVNTSGDPVITVSDTGLGARSTRPARIFEPLFSIHDGNLGLGLGATVSRDILDAMGGTMELTGTPGEGSCVRVTLPRDAGVSIPSPGLSRALSAAVVRRRTSVLVVDDEPLMLEMIQSMLEAEYDLATFSDPRAALAAMLAGSFDVILCDLMMPELTGMDIYERVCVERSALAGKFIFISGGAFTERARTFVASNTRPLLTKPFHRAELLELLDLIAAQWMGSPSGSGHSEGPQG